MLPILLLSLGALQFIAVDATILRFYNGAFDVVVDTDVDDPTPLLGLLDPTLGTVFYAHDLQDETTDITVESMVKAYLGAFNVVLITENNPEPRYAKAAAKVEKAGKKFGRALKKLVDGGLALSNCIFLGFGLGSHVLGVAARKAKGLQLPIIIAFEPSRIGFYADGGPIIIPGVDETSATFVVVVKTNTGGLGTGVSVGHMEITVNCGSRVQPGCTGTSGVGFRTEENICSQKRSVIYHVEAMSTPSKFIVRKSDSCDEWATNPGNETIMLGVPIDPSTRGKFYLIVNDLPPYGKGESGSYAN